MHLPFDNSLPIIDRKQKASIMKSKVFIVEPTPLNLSDTERYGTPTLLSSRKFNPFKAKENIDEIKSMLDSEDYDPDRDFICLTATSISLVSFILAARSFGSIMRVLIFDAKKLSYVERVL